MTNTTTSISLSSSVDTMKNITISDHPVVNKLISVLRDLSLKPSQVRGIIDEISRFLAYESTKSLDNSSVSVIPVLRSDVPIYHIGIFREKSTLQPIEYYNKLPKNSTETAIVLDPVMATGGTAQAVITTLQEWGCKRIVFVSVLASAQAFVRFSNTPGVEFVFGAIDKSLDDKGYLVPGIGDIGDRLYGAAA
ncbi:uracil phosphoribosyltransferase [Schizosaccharomyces cryophilus OY26]|uniref:uracil phosphoribosyltransferase n=1 Tax=Schizosaccharomyces cryophilus (strain OY26 / ATCC MYA-4695 / CBS 11777 / NBRC 106824 / NRRL Y48691) TaxID=653667 RepID=S9VX00_SCHCR|nr:uracil phosphoribosyltransferase [Schizosaccharomyces cryophilus OY26]EPY52183.1 uracil phosphoribosyltransferase [Schizosaccharomyces cryophilus OY26]